MTTFAAAGIAARPTVIAAAIAQPATLPEIRMMSSP
jgi:hypothetical protein